MRKISLFLALIMLVSMAAIPAGAEQETLQQPVVKTTTKKIIEVDGYQFRDLNGNGTLDVYEDWRADIEDRITDLLSQMTIEEEVGLLFHANSGGTFSPLYPKTEEWMYSHEPEIEVNGARYIPMWYMITEDHVNHYLDNNTGTPQEQIEYHNALQQIAEAQGSKKDARRAGERGRAQRARARVLGGARRQRAVLQRERDGAGGARRPARGTGHAPILRGGLSLYGARRLRLSAPGL